MFEGKRPTEPLISIDEFVNLVVYTFPEPITWAYRGAYAHLLAELVDCHLDIVEYLGHRKSHELFRRMARLSAVLMEDIRRCGSRRLDNKAHSTLRAINKLMSLAGLRSRAIPPDGSRFLSLFRRCTKHWDLEQLALLFQRRWR